MRIPWFSLWAPCVYVYNEIPHFFGSRKSFFNSINKCQKATTSIVLMRLHTYFQLLLNVYVWDMFHLFALWKMNHWIKGDYILVRRIVSNTWYGHSWNHVVDEKKHRRQRMKCHCEYLPTNISLIHDEAQTYYLNTNPLFVQKYV